MMRVQDVRNKPLPLADPGWKTEAAPSRQAHRRGRSRAGATRLFEYTEKFDGVLDETTVCASQNELEAAYAAVPDALSRRWCGRRPASSTTISGNCARRG